MKVAFVLCLLAMQGCNNHVANPILHDGKWGQANQAKSTVCASKVLEMARAMPDLSAPIVLQDSKELYWECIISLDGAL